MLAHNQVSIKGLKNNNQILIGHFLYTLQV